MSEQITIKQALSTLQVAIRGMIAERDKLDKTNIPELLEYYRSNYESEDTQDELHKILSGVKDNFSYEVIPDTFILA